ncbi:hypothetical protein ACWGNF_24280 [Streptomyces sp. NPDC055808]
MSASCGKPLTATPPAAAPSQADEPPPEAYDGKAPFPRGLPAPARTGAEQLYAAVAGVSAVVPFLGLGGGWLLRRHDRAANLWSPPRSPSARARTTRTTATTRPQALGFARAGGPRRARAPKGPAPSPAPEAPRS